MKNYVSEGKVIEATAGADYSSGDGVVIGELFGIATSDVKSGKTGVFLLTGIVAVAKTAADTFTAGCKCYWDASTKKVTTTASTNKLAGYYLGADGDNAVIRLPL